MKLQLQQYPILCYFRNTWMFSCCTKSKLIHFRSHIFYFRWGKHRKLKNITFCVPQQCSSPSVSKSLSWQHDWPWKYYFPNSKNLTKKFRSFSKIRLFSKLGNLTQLNFLVKLTRFSKQNDFSEICHFFEWENDIILLMNMQLNHSMHLLWHVLVCYDHVLQYHLEIMDHQERIVVGMKYQDHLLKKISVLILWSEKYTFDSDWCWVFENVNGFSDATWPKSSVEQSVN